MACRLAVGPCRHEVEPAARAEQAGAEAGHEVPTLQQQLGGDIVVPASFQLVHTLILPTLAPSADGGGRSTFRLSGRMRVARGLTWGS